MINLKWKVMETDQHYIVRYEIMPTEIVVFIFYDFEKTVRKTGWSVRGFWVIIERFSRRSRENLEIITQKPRTDHPVFRTVCLRSLRMWNVLFLGSCFPSQVKKFFIAVKKTTHIQGKYCIFSSLILRVVILLKRGMVWTHEVPTGTEWVQTIPSFTKIHHEQLMSGEMNFFSCFKNVVWRNVKNNEEKTFSYLYRLFLNFLEIGGIRQNPTLNYCSRYLTYQLQFYDLCSLAFIGQIPMSRSYLKSFKLKRRGTDWRVFHSSTTRWPVLCMPFFHNSHRSKSP